MEYSSYTYVQTRQNIENISDEIRRVTEEGRERTWQLVSGTCLTFCFRDGENERLILDFPFCLPCFEEVIYWAKYKNNGGDGRTGHKRDK